MLCRAIGVGRGGQEKKEPWKKIYVEVASHRKGCKMPQCYHYGVPRESFLRIRIQGRRR